MEKPLLWYVSKAFFVISWRGFVIWLSQFRRTRQCQPSCLAEPDNFSLQAKEVSYQHLFYCGVRSQSCPCPCWIWEGRKRARCFLYLLYLYAPSLPCPGRVEKENQPIFTDPNTPISDSANHAKLVGPQTLNWLCDIWHGTIVREFCIKENRPSHK